MPYLTTRHVLLLNMAVILFYQIRSAGQITTTHLRIQEHQQPQQHSHDQQHHYQQRLEFVHIPKTGGTVIESIAAAANITWSICHFGNINWKFCQHQPNGLKYVWPKDDEFNNCPWWHVPPAYALASFPEHNPYVDADLFTVVRNPYERMISEYYYRIQVIQSGKKKEDGMNNEWKFNDNLNKQLSSFFQKSRRPHTSRKLPGNKKYFMNGGHMIPMYDFVYDVDHHKKMVKHVLRFENLSEEFSTLMEQYDLPLELPTKKIGRASHNKLLGVHNLTNENLKLIETIYWDDFVEFGYEMISSKMTEDGISGD